MNQGSQQDDRNMAVVAHLLGIILMFIGPLIIWLIKKDSSPYAADQSREALNFQITVTIIYVAMGALSPILFFVTCFLFPALWIAVIVLAIMAAMASSRGEKYRYPFAIRLVN